MNDLLQLPEMTMDRFMDHAADEDFSLRFGNPVIIHGENGPDLVCMAREYYERLTCQLEEKKEDERVKYWIFEFQMPEEVKQTLEELCALQEMTMDEFFASAVLSGMQMAKADPEGFRKQCLEAQKTTDPDIQLVRCYPVYKGETEAQAYRRKLAEEAKEKQMADEPVNEERNAEGKGES